MNTRVRWVDGMKGVAICGIVMIHSGGGALPDLLGSLGNIGKNGVQVFFMISAYLAFRSMERAFHSGMSKKIIGKWLLDRFLRLIPLYYIFCIFGILTGGNGYWLGSEDGITLGNILAHFCVLHGLFPQYCNSITGIEWYLGALAIFYLLAPLLYKTINTLKKSVTAWICCAFLCTWISVTAREYLITKNASYVYTLYFEEFSIIAQLPVLLLGVALYHALRQQKMACDRETIVTSYAMLAFSVVMIGGMAICESNLFGLSRFALFGMWFFVLAYSQSMHTTFLIGNPVFEYLGKYSYPIFWTHIWMISVYNKFVSIPITNVIVAWLIKYSLVLGVSAAIALPLTELVEKRILACVRKRVGTSDK